MKPAPVDFLKPIKADELVPYLGLLEVHICICFGVVASVKGTDPESRDIVERPASLKRKWTCA
jgi:hypothetical protein